LLRIFYFAKNFLFRFVFFRQNVYTVPGGEYVKKGKRIDTGAVVPSRPRIFRRVWDFLKEHKKISIIAGASLVALTLAVLAILSLIGGGPVEGPPEEPPIQTEPEPSAEPEPEPEPEPILFDYINPLTGLPFSNDEALGLRRPIAVMHNNSHQPGGRHHALPMFGIGKADIIYEVLAEGATTRMLAFYQDFAPIPKIGAVRSTRTYYVELALSYDAILVHAGESPDARREIREWGVARIDGLAQPTTHFWRDRSDRPNVSSEHTMFTSGERLMELFEKITRQTMNETFDNGMNFTEWVVPSGGAAGKVTVPFSNHKRTIFVRNEDDGLYYVEQYNAPFIDGEDGEQVTITNLLIIQTGISVIPGDTEGRLRVDLRSGGSGYYVSGGQYIPITWDSRGHSEPFSYFTADGDPLEMAPGKTYVCVVPTGSEPVFE
jgi:hypothetical protein